MQNKYDTCGVKRNWLNRKLSDECFILNGIKEGKYVMYDINGNIEYECNYIYGKKNGICKSYTDGNLMKECTFIDDDIRLCKVYDKEYNLKREVTYNRTMNDILTIPFTMNGPFREYYKNGQVLFECILINNKKNGKYKRYAENGDLLYECNYVDDAYIDDVLQ